MENFDADSTWLALEYLRGNLSEPEMDAVEARMATDRAFYLLVHDLRHMQKVQSEREDSQVNSRVQAAADAFFNEAAPQRMKVKWQWLAASAAAAILIFSVIFFSIRDRSYVGGYFEPAPWEQSLGPSSPDAIRAGMKKYAGDDYKGAIKDFESIADTAQEFNTANYFLANTYLQLGERQAALKSLLILESMDDQKYLVGRRWLLGLIYLDLGEKEKGEKELRALYDDPTTIYKKSAIREILDL